MDNTYSDAEYVEGVLRHDHVLERALHYLCKKYFDENYQRVFFVGDEYKDDIFQEAFIQLWENIGNGKIYVENRQIYGRNGMPLSGKLTSYSGMGKVSGARNKHHRRSPAEGKPLVGVATGNAK